MVHFMMAVRQCTYCLVGTLILLGCGGLQKQLADDAVSPKQLSELIRIRERFFGAREHSELVAAVKAAGDISSNSSIFNEIAGELALLEGKHSETNTHFINALATCQAGDVPHLLGRLQRLSFSLNEMSQLIEILVRRLETDPAHVHGVTADMLYELAHLLGHERGMAMAQEKLSGVLRPWFVGPFDNDQGKAFNVVYPPETDGVVADVVAGSVIPVRWRQIPVQDAMGFVHFQELLNPTDWQTSYAQSEIDLMDDSEIELRITTSDPVKIWVNRTLVFESRTIKKSFSDNVVVPLALAKGRHRVLVKSMNEARDWKLRMRMTGKEGASIKSRFTEVSPLNGAHASLGDFKRLAAMQYNSDVGSYGQFRMINHLLHIGESKRAVEVGQAAVLERASILLTQQFIVALVGNKERGRASDLLNEMDDKFGELLPLFSIELADFWSSQKMNVKARTLLRKRLVQAPGRWPLVAALVRNFNKEKWFEESTVLLEETLNEATMNPNQLTLLAQSYKNLREWKKAWAVYRRIIDSVPNHLPTLKSLYWLSLGSDFYEQALEWSDRIQRSYPEIVSQRFSRAETLRRSGDLSGAIEELTALEELLPTSAKVQGELGKIYLRQSQVKKGLASLQKGLDRDPENRALAKRIAWLGPQADGPWREDIPSDRAIAQLIKNRNALKVSTEGANVVYLMDDEVSWLQKDGSTYNVVTMVVHALNQEGRDEVTQMVIRSGGQHQLLNAYAVKSNGQRIEASSIRGRSVRYRQLDVGSTVVLQYRIDARPEAYLAAHIDRGFWFQATDTAVQRARWVLWVPKDVVVNQERTELVRFAESERDGLRRLEWAASDLPAIVRESYMPSLGEVAERVQMSTVPDWKTFGEWEKALLVDAYRESPAVKAVASEILKSAKGNLARIYAIHDYVIRNIRYQQDYEETIAGVKPHAAAQVIERQYGDCKDKAILFIALAREAGIDVHFTSVRTRDRGPLLKAVPSQQFNHAIVFVPKQDGIEEELFLDPTVDTLDLKVLRNDDQGTLAYVFDGNNQVHYWKNIPFQPPETNYVNVEMNLALDRKGGVRGTVRFHGQGGFAALLRQAARNETQFKQRVGQAAVNVAAPGGLVKDVAFDRVSELDKPVDLTISFEGTGRMLSEGKTQRWKVPIRPMGMGILNVKDRKYPYLMGPMSKRSWQITLEVPKAARVSRLPEPVRLSHRCLTFDRRFYQKNHSVIVEQSIISSCDRVSVDDVRSLQELTASIKLAEESELVLRYP